MSKNLLHYPGEVCDEPQREEGREFKNKKLKDGYVVESMYKYPRDRRTVQDRRWREDCYGDD